jgi:signal transduction histidine kinase
MPTRLTPALPHRVSTSCPRWWSSSGPLGCPLSCGSTGTAHSTRGVDLAVYRIVQEALTNALKHAGTATTVRLAQHRGHVRITVRNAVPSRPVASNPGGHGLVGMRERVELYGGVIQVGAQPDGGFLVDVTLPVVADTTLETVR